MRNRSLLLVVLVAPMLAAAQTAAEATSVATNPPVARSAAWNIGAGVGVTSGQVIGLSTIGVLSLGQPASLLGLAPTPSLTFLVERRVSDRLFLTFQAAASYSSSQDELDARLSGSSLSLDAQLGVRQVLNPGGVVEVSWFASVGYRYGQGDSHFLMLDSAGTGTLLETIRFQSHSFGATAGLALERELVQGLALRLSSGILAASYGVGSATQSTSESSLDGRSHQAQLGLRFSPTLELRYAL